MLRTGLTLGFLLIAACEPDDVREPLDTGESEDVTPYWLDRVDTIDARNHPISAEDAYRLGILNDDQVPYDTLFPGQDTDGDGLYDAFELEQGLDPLNPDSDSDGIHDHWDLLGSEHIDPRLTGGGFAWFDPSKTERPDMGEEENRARRVYGLYFVPTQLTDVIVFGSNSPDPVGFRCHNLGMCNLYDYLEGWPNYSSTLLNFVFYEEPPEYRVWWSIIHFSGDYSSSGGPRIAARGKQDLALQTAPVHGAPQPHWGPDPDADGLSFDQERELGTNPLRWDTDFDGIPDGAENNHGLDPASNDSDDDGVQDLEQVLTQTEIQDDYN